MFFKVRLKVILLVLIIILFVSPLFSGIKIVGTKVNSDVASILYAQALTESNLHQREYLLQLAYSLNPSDDKISFLLGKTLIINNNNKLAKVILHKLAENPELKGRIFKYLGEYYYQKRDFLNANNYYKKLIEVGEENNFLNNYRLGEINGKDGLKYYYESNKYYLKAYELRKYKDDDDILFFVANNYYNLKKYNETINYLKMYPHTNGNNQKAFKLLIKAHYRLRNKAELTTQVNKYLKIWPKSRWIRLIINKMNKNISK
ncbi:MAG: hypothetical protein OEV44_03380 [Spirochaetota bacterium]|nr:hypothetical protein [Spirochaetota bacterium]